MINDSITMRSLSSILIVYSNSIFRWDQSGGLYHYAKALLYHGQCTNSFTYHCSDCHALLPHYLLYEKIIIEMYNHIALKYTYWWSKSLSIICFVTAVYIYIYDYRYNTLSYQ